MSERDPLPALRGLIDEPIAPRSAFAEELRARLLTELGSHRPAAIDEERTMEITTPGLQLVLPGQRIRQLPSWRRLAEIAALIVLVFGVIAVFASERVGSPSNPPPTAQGNLGVYPQNFATPDPNVVNEAERDLGVLWKIPASTTDAPLADIGAFMGTIFFLEKDRVVAVDSESGSIKWQTSVARGWGLLADAQGIYVTTSTEFTGGESVLLKLSFQTGEEEWRTPVGLYPGKPILYQGIIYVWNTANTLYALSAGSGLELWNQDFSHIPMTPLAVQNYVDSAGRLPVSILDGDNIIVGTSDARVGRIDITGVANNHDWIWSVQLDYSKRPGFEIAIAGNAVAAVMINVDGTKFDGELIAWNRETGEELWRGGTNANFAQLVSTGDAFVTTTEATTYATPTAQELIVQGASIVNMVAYEPQIGRELWEVPNAFPVGVSVDDTIVIAGTDNVWTAAVDAKTGAVLGSTYPMGFIFSPFLVDSTALYGTRGDGMLVAIDIDALKNGTLEGGEIPGSTPEAIQSPESDSAVLWQTKPEGDVRWAGQSVVSNGMVFRLLTTSDFQGVEAYDTVTGTLLWRHAVQGTELVADDTGVYVTLGRYANPEMTISATPEPFVIGPNDASVIKLDPQTGNELWSTNTGTGESSPVLIDGTLYLLESADIWNVARGTTQEATAIDASNGSILWSETVGAPMGQNLVGGYGRMVATNSHLVGLLGNGSMVGIDRATGAVQWEQQARFDPLNLGLSIAASGDTVVVSVYGATTMVSFWLPEFPELQSHSAVIAYNASDGTPLWAVDTGGIDSNVTIADGFVVVLAGPSAIPGQSLEATPEGAVEPDWELIGIDLSTGELAWKGMSGFGSTYPSPYIVAQSPGSETVYVINRTMRASFDVVDPTTGLSASGGLDFDQPIDGIPVNDGTHVFVQLRDGTLVATLLPVPPTTQSGPAFTEEVPVVMPSTPEETASPEGLLWTSSPESGEFEASSAVFAGNVVVRALKTSDFYGIEGLNTLSGEQLWSIDIGWTGAPVSDGRVVYVPATASESDAGAVYAIDPLTGNIRWETTFGGPVVATPNLQLDGIYVMSSNDMVTVLDPISGNKRWESPMDSSAFAFVQFPDLRAPVVAANLVVAMSNSGTLYAFDRYTGEELWSKPGYSAATARFAGIADVLVVVDGVNTLSTPEAEIDPALPMRIERVDLLTGDTLWTLPALLALPGQPIVQMSQDAIGTKIYVLVEHVLTAGGLYDENGFHPDGTPTPTAPTSEAMSEGTLITIQASSGNVASLQFDQQFAYGSLGVGENGALLTWPHRTPTNNGQEIDLGQPVYGAPVTDDQIFLITLQDGTLVALDANATRGG